MARNAARPTGSIESRRPGARGRRPDRALMAPVRGRRRRPELAPGPARARRRSGDPGRVSRPADVQSLRREGDLVGAAGARAPPGPRPGEAGAQSLPLDLEELLGIRKARQVMSAERAEAEAGRCRLPDGGPRLAGHDDLPSVSRRADPCRGVDGETDVPDIGERRTAAVNPHPHPDFEIIGPGPETERTLEGHGRFDAVRWPARRPRRTRRRGHRSHGRSLATPRPGGCLSRRSARHHSGRPADAAGRSRPRCRSSGA